MNIYYDYSKLRGLIREKCGTQAIFAKKIGISTTSLYQRLNNSVPFTQNEIIETCKVLNCPLEDIDKIFFKIKSIEE